MNFSNQTSLGIHLLHHLLLVECKPSWFNNTTEDRQPKTAKSKQIILIFLN